MTGQFIAVTMDELQSYLQDSSLLEARLKALGMYSVDPAFFDVDKSWDALSFLLSDHTLEEIDNAQPPLSWTIIGDKTIDENQDLGYGPARYLTSEQVKEVNNALATISIEQIKENYDGEKMNTLGIYPEGWEYADSKIWLVESFEELKSFYEKTAANDWAIVCFIG